MMPFVWNHLWQSTLFAAVPITVALLLRRHSARIRFWLWLAASLKFLIPFAWLADLGRVVAWRAAPLLAPAPPALTTLITPFAMPAPAQLYLSPLARPVPAFPPLWIVLLGVAWASGSLAILFTWTSRRRRAADMLRSACPAMGRLAALPIPVRLAAPATEPGVVGIFRQVLLLPEDFAASPGVSATDGGVARHFLSEAVMDGIIAHELCHARRHDNLWSALHTLVEAAFWFHPLVWWIGARMTAERELACDEAALSDGVDPQRYAAALLQAWGRYGRVSARCVAGVAGGSLTRRVAAILHFDRSRNRSARLRVATLLLMAISVMVPVVFGYAQQNRSQPQRQLRFEVASVKEWRPGQGPSPLVGGIHSSPGRITSQCADLLVLVHFAFHLTGTEPVEGLPAWGSVPIRAGDCGDTFAINATMPAATTPDQARAMMQSLLEDRFQLAFHWQSRTVPVFELVVAPGGVKIHASNPGKDSPLPANFKYPPCPSDDRNCGMLSIGSWSMQGLAGILSRQPGIGRPIVDKTGLNGSFYIRAALRWRSPGSATTALPGLPTALREQLGLELKPAQDPVPVLVIDHVEKPQPN